MMCRSCGAVLPDDALFCPACGASTAVPVPDRDPLLGPGTAWETTPPAMPDDLFRNPDDTAIRPLRPALGAPVSDAASQETRMLGAQPVPPLVRPASLVETLSPPPPRRNGGLALVVILTLVVVAGVIGAIVLFTSTPQAGTTPRASSAPVSSTSARPATPASPTTSSTPSRPSSPASTSSTPTPAAAFPPAGGTLCPGSTTVAVGASTSCEFAANVEAGVVTALRAGVTGTFPVKAHSPVTQKDYDMSCTRTTYTTCTGGDGATVYVR